MAQEREIKIILKITIEDFIDRAIKFGFVKEKSIQQTDQYFDTENWDLYKSAAALRIRSVNGKEKELTYKKIFYMPKRENPWYVQEIETALPSKINNKLKELFELLGINSVSNAEISFEDIRKLLKKVGLQGKQIMDKNRQIYRYGDNELAIDEIIELGTVLELECKNSEPTDLVKNLLKPSEWKRSIEGTSYMWLEKKLGLTYHKLFTKKFKNKQDWNVSLAEKLWYAKNNIPDN